VLKKALFGLPDEWRKDEPSRPVRPAPDEALEPDLHNELARCHHWIDWADTRMQEIWRAIIDADVERELTAKKESVKTAQLRQQHDSAIWAVQNELHLVQRNNSAEKLEEAGRRIAAVERREAALAAAEANIERAQAHLNTYADLCKDVQDLGIKIKDAVREMKTMTGCKGHSEHAFKRWESMHCGPEFKSILTKVNKQQSIEEDINRVERAERLNAVLEREAELAELATQKETEIARVVEERAKISEERRKLREKEQRWIVQRGRELNDDESKAALEALCAEEIDKVKPAMLAEAKRLVSAAIRLDWEAQKTAVLSIIKEEGHRAGYLQGSHDGHGRGKEEGYTQGKNASLEEMNARMAQEKATSHAEGHEAGFTTGRVAGRSEGLREGREAGLLEGHWEGVEEGTAAGYEDGYAEGLEKGKEEGHGEGHEAGFREGSETRRDDERWMRKKSEYIGFHKAMLLCSSGIDSKLPESTEREENAYWWGRALGYYIDRERW